MVWLKIENVGFLKVSDISYVGEVDLVEIDDLTNKNLYGFELVVGGELLPLVYDSREKAIKVNDAIKKQLLMSAKIIKLEV